jgi:hypothetical protein
VVAACLLAAWFAAAPGGAIAGGGSAGAAPSGHDGSRGTGGPRLAPASAAEGRGAGEPAEPDTSVERFLGGLADSTDSYFGASAAPVDTAGLDSALAYAFENPLVENLKGTLRPALSPWFDFNRVDGAVWGLGAGIGREPRWGRIGVEAGWAAGPDDLLGGVRYEKHLGPETARWTLRVRGGRRTANLDRARGDSYLSTMRALVTGGDRSHYLRREGFGATLARQTPTYRMSAGWRDERELPLAVTATWNLFGRTPEVPWNAAAARGRAREFEFEGLWRVPWAPVQAQAVHHTSSRSFGSDFEYRRTFLAAGADVGLGRHFSLVPQLGYGRLSGEAVAQASFYLGGSRTLRSLEGQSRGGTGLALARLDLIAVPDLLALARIPHPAMFPLQGSVFLASGATWGADPYGGPSRPGLDWPNQEEWQSEAGFALHWQPGIPDPQSYLRFSFGFGLGANDGRNFTVTYTRALDLLRGLGE